MLYNIISGLRLHVTGLMNNADNLITIFFLNGKFTDPAFIPSIVQFKVAHLSAKCAFQVSRRKTSILDSVFIKSKTECRG